MFHLHVVHEGVWLVLVEPELGRVGVTLTASRDRVSVSTRIQGYPLPVPPHRPA